MSTLILGGGVTGLAAAWRLQQRGETVEVWEAGASVGGWMKTLPWEGGHFETGPQGVLWQKGTAVDRLFSALDLPFRSPGTGARWVGKGGRLIPVPASPPGLMLSPLMSLGAKLRMMAEPFIPVRRRGTRGGPFGLHRPPRLARASPRNCCRAMVAGVLAAPADILSVDAIPKLRQWEATGSLVNGIRKSGVSHMVVPEGGMGQLPIRLASELSTVRTGLRAERLERAARTALARARRAAKCARRTAWCWPCRPTRPPPSWRPAPPPKRRGPAGAIPYTSVDLWHSRHAPLPPSRTASASSSTPRRTTVTWAPSCPPGWIPRCAPGDRMQLRSFIGGAFGKPADLDAWEGVFARLVLGSPPSASPWPPVTSGPSGRSPVPSWATGRG